MFMALKPVFAKLMDLLEFLINQSPNYSPIKYGTTLGWPIDNYMGFSHTRISMFSDLFKDCTKMGLNVN